MRQCLCAIVRLAEPSCFPTTFGTLHGAAAIDKVRETPGAGSYCASPGCEAVTVHEPTPVRCTVAVLTAQFPLAAKETNRPEEAVALTLKSGAP